MQDEFDRNLRLLFEEQSRKLPEEPFLSKMLLTIRSQQSQRTFIKQMLIPLLGFAICALLSPLLIRSSLLLSNYLNTMIDAAGGLMDKPTAIWTGLLSCILLLWLLKRRLFLLLYRVSMLI